jgi:hypothetical protein
MFLAEINLNEVTTGAYREWSTDTALETLVLIAVTGLALRLLIEHYLTIYFFIKTFISSRKRRPSCPPGSKILRFVDFFFSPKTVERTFKPLVADLQLEYFEAISLGMKWKARWIRVRYSYRAIMAMGPSKVWELAKMFLPSGKSEKADK